MRLRINYNFLSSAVLLYPLLLGVIYAFDFVPFFITAPYFFGTLVLLIAVLWPQRKLGFARTELVNLLILLTLLIISFFNFSSLRFSLPILFSLYLFFYYLYLAAIDRGRGTYEHHLLRKFYLIYILVSFFFLLLLPHAHMEIGDRFTGFTGSPTTFSAFLAAVFVILDGRKKSLSFERIGLYMITLVLVYLSKTRLILVFLLAYPILIFLLRAKGVRKSFLFMTFFTVLFFLYEVYGLIIDYFPGLITIRYEDARDASFGLRYHLYQVVKEAFYQGQWHEIFLGRGNEEARLLVHEDIGFDIFPHNDFLRLLYDWGVLGGSLYFIFLYRIAKRNQTALFLSLLYLILFYSNLVFNLFLVSLLLLSALKKEDEGNSQNTASLES